MGGGRPNRVVEHAEATSGSAGADRHLPAPSRRAANRLTQLQRVTARLVVAASAEEIGRAVAQSVTEDFDNGGTGQAWCQVWLLDGERITLGGASASAPPAVGGLALSGPTAVAACVRERSAVFGVTSLASLGCRQEAAEPSSACVIPVVLRGDPLGALVMAYEDEAEVDGGEREFLVAMADLAAQALDRASLYARQAEMARTSAFLADSAQVLAEAAGYADALERLATLALSVLGDICLIDVLDEHGDVQRMVGRHRDPARQGLVDQLSRAYPPARDSTHPAVAVISAGRSSWMADLSDEFLRQTAEDEHQFALTKSLGLRSYLSVPLLNAGVVLGALSLVSSDRPFGPADVAFAERLARQVAALVDNARRFDATLQTSHILQRSLLPRSLPHVAGLTVDTRYLPSSRGLEVGGDFYDVIMLPSLRVGFMIGDVAGHNRDAAAVMGQLRAAARALAGQVHTPAELIGALQWSWDLLGFDRIATALFGRLDPSTGELIMASAGHHPPLLVERGRGEYLPVAPTTPLGAPEMTATNWEGRLAPGQVLLLYTDGVVDQRAGDGMDCLAEVAAGGEARPAAVCERVTAMLPSHRQDDVTLLALGLAG